MRPSSCASPDAAHEVGAHLPGAQHEQEAPAAQDMALSAERCRDRPFEPGMVCRYHLHPDAARLPLSCGNHGLVQPQGDCLAAVQQHGCRLLRGSVERGVGKIWYARDIQHRSGQPVHQWCLDRRVDRGKGQDQYGRKRLLDRQPDD